MPLYRRFAMLAMVAISVSFSGPIPLRAQVIDVTKPASDQGIRRDNETLSDSLKLLELQLVKTRTRLAAAANDESSSVAKMIERTGKRHQRKLNKIAASVRKLEDVVSEQATRLSEALEKISDLERDVAVANHKLQALTESHKNTAEAGPSVASIAKQLQAQSVKIDLAIRRLEALQKQVNSSTRKQEVVETAPKPVIRYQSIPPEQLLEEIIKRREFDEATKRDFDEAMNRLKAIEDNFGDSTKQPDAMIENDVEEKKLQVIDGQREDDCED